jgi:membrane protease YdiL (CAAX protease family)
MAVLNMRRLLDECVVSPLNEEPVFRGLVLLYLSSAFDRWRWEFVILSAAILSACHSAHQVVTSIATIILAAILAVFFLRTKSLSGSIVLYAAWNAGIFLDLQKF